MRLPGAAQLAPARRRASGDWAKPARSCCALAAARSCLWSWPALADRGMEAPEVSRCHAPPGESLPIGALALAIFTGGAGLATLPQDLWQADDTVAGCAVQSPEIAAEPFLGTGRFFGMSYPNG